MPVLAVVEDPSARSSLVTDIIGPAEDALLDDLFFGGRKPNGISTRPS